MSDSAPPAILSLSIDHTWDGKDIDLHATIKLYTYNDTYFKLIIDSKYYNNFFPLLSSSSNASNCYHELWNYEVIELFISNNTADINNCKYLELEFSPHNVNICLLFNGYRNFNNYGLDIIYNSKINNNVWHGEALIPIEYLPNYKLQSYYCNAFAIYDNLNNREYLASTPLYGDKPDFHKINLYKKYDLTLI